MKRLLSLTIISATTFFGCSKSDPDAIVLDPSEISLNRGETHQILVNSKSALTYEVENDFHAEVSGDGKVTAGYVGETNILVRNAEDSKPLKIIVNPRNKLYPDPVLEYGRSKSEIRSKYGAPATETESAIGYNNYSANAPILLFLFDDNGACNTIVVLVRSSLLNQMVEFVQERFIRISSTELYFADSFDPDKAKSIINVRAYNADYYGIFYMEATNFLRGLRVSNPSDTFRNDIEEYLNR